MNEELKSKFEAILTNMQSYPVDYTDLFPTSYTIKAMQAAYDMAKADEWVSVETALPEIGSRVWAWSKALNKGIEIYYNNVEYSKWFTHWQPLPKKPNQ